MPRSKRDPRSTPLRAGSPLRGPARQIRAEEKTGPLRSGWQVVGWVDGGMRCGRHRRGRLQKAGPTRAKKKKEAGFPPRRAGRKPAPQLKPICFGRESRLFGLLLITARKRLFAPEQS